MTLYPNHKFETTFQREGERARLGLLHTPHGTIETPNYIFCGTRGSIKNLHPYQMKEAQADIILANTYHMMIQPGSELVQKMGGLHKFMSWDGPMLTDSGGFQIFSLGHTFEDKKINKNQTARPQAKLIKITDEAAIFTSYKTGEKIELSPERSIQIQHELGADLIVQMDECPAYELGKDYIEKSMEMSIRWGLRSLDRFKELNNGTQGLYGVIQGGFHPDLRTKSAQYVRDNDFFGTAIGGVVGNDKHVFEEIVAMGADYHHPDRPIHLLGIGELDDIFTLVRYGIDTFDCVNPTRIARHGWAHIKGAEKGRINLRNAQFKEDETPLDETLGIEASTKYSKAYIHHLLKAGELLAYQILAQHNVALITKMMREVRTAIKDGTLDNLQKEWIA